MLNRNVFNELLAIAEQIEPYYIEMEVKQTLIPFIYIYLFSTRWSHLEIAKRICSDYLP